MDICAIISDGTLPATLRDAAIASSLRPSIIAVNMMNWMLWV